MFLLVMEVKGLVVVVEVFTSYEAETQLARVLYLRCRVWKADMLVANHCALLPNTQATSMRSQDVKTLA